MAFDAKYRVKRGNKTEGFILSDGNYYNTFNVMKNIGAIRNLKVISNGAIRASKELPIMTMTDVNRRKLGKIESRNPFKRDIQDTLIKWKNTHDKKVLQLWGARQIGKTTELVRFALRNYSDVVYVNLANDSGRFIREVRNFTPVELENYCRLVNLPSYRDSNRTLLIIDEIQISSEVYNKIRGLDSGLRCDIIVTGSYLGQTLGRDFFQPAGTIEDIKMHPLSFGEFCGIYGKRSALKRISLTGKSKESEYEELDKLYEVYKVIGGYPNAITAYMKNNDVNDAHKVIRGLLSTFERESRNYFQDTNEPAILGHVYRVAALEMLGEKRGSGNKITEIVHKIAKNSQNMMISKQEIRSAINWAVYSGIIGYCHLYNPVGQIDIEEGRRTYFLDCGIASYIIRDIRKDQSNKDGLLTETFVYGELYRLYGENLGDEVVWGKDPAFSLYNEYELDFTIQASGGEMYGIEVKTTGGSTKSLDEYLKKKFIDKAVRAMKTKGGADGNILTIPIYTVGERFPYK